MSRRRTRSPAPRRSSRTCSKPRPMDRLLCGDVGYGKTELAMRAAFKACRVWQAGGDARADDGAGRAALSHRSRSAWRIIRSRSTSISRFKTDQASRRKRSSRLRPGEIDILIGTHRLISKDVKFADLGLVVIDEEQRFGVTHKERLKQMRKTVDVLTMSATPIPRTLHMCMLGLRDISSLTTAPQDRRSVVTEVMALRQAAHEAGDPARAQSRGADLFRPQPRAQHHRDGG